LEEFPVDEENRFEHLPDVPPYRKTQSHHLMYCTCKHVRGEYPCCKDLLHIALLNTKMKLFRVKNSRLMRTIGLSIS